MRQGFDSAGRLDWQEEPRANGTLQYYTDWDQVPGSGNAWQHFINYYDAAGNPVTTPGASRHIFYDNGTDIWI